jgi:hypothetical protein
LTEPALVGSANEYSRPQAAAYDCLLSGNPKSQ